jgi:hypothetical protein
VKTPQIEEDQFLGQTFAFAITPPHSAANVKRYIMAREQITQETPAQLFADISGRNVLDDTEFLDIVNQAGVGFSPDNPIALVISPTSALPVSPTSSALPRRAGYKYTVKAKRGGEQP